ncbi:7714_t:CDS:2 [Cetraspora pellucida]|uniref:7714_t:CDS:1 n=1 Tax=Cetraspora pellucida TaxID=1433469 RepID=A0ACA9K4S2_9GLOM|nr:7714_t:CDS:2 [Cetraspora pellucida]
MEQFPTLENLMENLVQLPEEIKNDVRFFGGGLINHNFFFAHLTKFESEQKERERTEKISPDLLNLIQEKFGSLEKLKKELVKSALKDGPWSLYLRPLIAIDVWEHAYYLDYGANRKEYAKKVVLNEEKKIMQIELNDLRQGLLFSPQEFQETRFQTLILPATSQVRKSLLENDVNDKRMVIKGIQKEPTLASIDEKTIRLTAGNFGAVEIVNEENENPFDPQNRQIDLYFQVNATDKSHSISGSWCNEYRDHPRLEEFADIVIGRIDLVFDNQDSKNMELFHQWDSLLKEKPAKQKFVIRNIPLQIRETWYALDNFKETNNADLREKAIHRGKKVKATQVGTKGLEEQLKLEKVLTKETGEKREKFDSQNLVIIKTKKQLMNQLFKDPDPRRKWHGYRSYFYPHEYQPIGSKPLEWIHIHFIGQKGEIEIYLKDYRILTK